MDGRWFDGLGDTLRILADAVGEAAPVQLAQLEKDLASAFLSRPNTLGAARQSLDRLAKSAAELSGRLEGDPAGPANG
jgi:cyclic beta-1,2-glucan synthetase